MQYSYDRQGNVISWTYPNSTLVKVSYNNAGLPSRIQRKPLGGSFNDIVGSLTYAPTGQSISTIFGSGASTTRTYNADTLYRLSNLRTLVNSSNVQNFAYTYDAFGNITQIANPAVASSSATTAFTYDALNRLLSASTTAADSIPYKQQYEYDTLGSILAWATNNAASSTYSYSNADYANPHAVTQVSNGTSTTTYTYDANGNLSQKITDGVTTTYIWDYANRLTALGVNNSTTTYGYDAFGARAFQIATTSTTTYPWKFYSVASTTRSGTNYATTTEYVFNGDTLLSTIDNKFINGAATGTAEVRYIHPDHMGSTNIVSNASSTAILQTLDYFPYGATRISTSVSGADSGRKFIGQFADTSNLDYLNARYYDSARGQFISQDPVFWEDPLSQNLENPQSLNSYSYALNNPVNNKDPNGEIAIVAVISILLVLSAIVAGLAAIQASGGGGSTAFGEALRGIDQVLTGVGNYVQSVGGKAIAGTVGAVSAITISQGANVSTLPPITSYGGTAVTTPYAIGTPNWITTDTTSGTTNINLSKGGSRSQTQRPTDAPSGTIPIDRAKVPKDVIHKIKDETRGNPDDWYGITREKDVIRTGPDGKTEYIGPLEHWI